jgi:glucosamine--fructose-6-phosphate aminotransferase (isomerizing)
VCGIVGYIGNQDAKEILLAGLEKLEYRGYDSAGIALLHENGVALFKEKGRIEALRKVVDQTEAPAACAGIGHTRWATHGGPSQINAHPHQSPSRRFTIVHNGVIENYKELRDTYLQDVPQASQTDTEIIVQLIEKLVEEGYDVREALRHTLIKLKGSYAVALLDNMDHQTIYLGKNKSPLLLGLGEGCYAIASDAMAMLKLTNQFVEIMDQEIVIVRRDGFTIMDLNSGDTDIQRDPFTAKLDASEIEKGPYNHYMLKEIDEQPIVIRHLISKYQDENGELCLDPIIREAVTATDRLYIIACGTSYHAGLVGKPLLEKISGIPTEVHIASEFLYNPPILSERPLFIFVSQSGETADSRGVLVEVKKQGFPSLTITNVPGSTLSRESDYTLLTHAGPEIAVASTKAYIAQIAVLALLACDCAQARGLRTGLDIFQELSLVANGMEILVNQKEAMEEMVWNYLSMSQNCFFIGRGMDYYVCLEGALKLKEISYIQAEGFAGGELKHGTLALIEEGTAMIALSTQSRLDGNIRSNVQEVLARGANVCMMSMEGLEQQQDALVLPRVHEYLSPLISVIPMQLVAYYAAYFRGCDIDKPRNLAKSVTVE